MIRKTHLQLFALASALSFVGAVSGLADGPRGSADKTLADLAGYRQWTRVTPEPMPVNNPTPAG
ncbi:MAG: hypothetical protein M3444_16885 [Acidobacteriota bacterium]|nr:hypothetical protein [Acidobacteriota bacterium]MDQ5837192.1 hypothetical protein [Acidobacteriota bacterium]